ncbi:thymidylate synthase [Candidatus Peregrinibacteria bacterium]|nr:thymidylate synthase [Candidatus Peregrinibacteria bacterium]
MKQYLELVSEVLEHGIKREDRTGTGTISIFGMQKKYDLREGFPLVTTKKVNFESVIRELLWFLRGSTNIHDDLTQHTPIWDLWADEKGELGPIYGYQWRKWETYEPVAIEHITTKSTNQKKKRINQKEMDHQGIHLLQVQMDKGKRSLEQIGIYKKRHIDQIQNAIDLIKNHPESRRIIVSGWNVADIEKMALPPCHTLFQFYVVNGRLDCQLYQRSADIALGVPYNIASYSALLTMMAQECDLTPGIFVHTLGDAHIYLNHIEGLKEQLTRKPYDLPRLKLKKKPIWDVKLEDFELTDYQHCKFIKFPIAV